VGVRLPQAAVRYIVPSHDVTGFYYLEGALFFGFLVAVGIAVIRVNRPEYGVAGRSTRAAAILFVSIAVVWGVSTVESAWIKIPAIAIVGIIVAISLTEALLIKNRKFPTQSNSVASGAPDPRRFDEDGQWQTKPNLQFPAAPTRFTLMSTPELKRQLQYTAHDLQRIQDQFTTEMGKAGPDRISAALKKYATMYEEKFSTLAFSLAFCVSPICPTTRSTASVDMKQPFGAKLARSCLRSMPWIAANRRKDGPVFMSTVGMNCRPTNATSPDCNRAERRFAK
jgi:hypothetical protein